MARDPSVEISSRDWERIRNVVEWRTRPSFPDPGRTAWLELEDPGFARARPEQRVRAAKLKGVGYSSGSEEQPLRTPSGRAAYRPAHETPHFGIEVDGSFALRYGEKSPLGALLEHRAQTEYLNARILAEAKVPCVRALAIFRYERKFRGAPLAVVVTLSPEPSPRRLRSAIATGPQLDVAGAEQYRASVWDRLGARQLSEPDALTSVFVQLAERVGSAARGLADAGLHIHSCGWENFQFDRRNGDVLLIDLDSTLLVDGLPARRQGAERLRDLAGAVHKVVEEMYYPPFLEMCGLDRLIGADPVGALFRGYFPDAERSAAQAAQVVNGYVLPHVVTMWREMRVRGTAWPRETREPFKVNRYLLYALSILAARAPAIDARILAPRDASYLGDPNLARNLLGSETAYLEWALSES